MGFKITRLSAKYAPASVSVECTSEDGTKTYRKFPLAFGYFSNPEVLSDTLWEDYPEYFNEETIDRDRLLDAVKEIIAKAPKIDIDLTSKDEIERFKKQMDHEFDKNAILPGDPNFVYDVEEDFGEADEPCDWDD